MCGFGRKGYETFDVLFFNGETEGRSGKKAFKIFDLSGIANHHTHARTHARTHTRTHSPKLGNRGKIYTERFTTLKRRFDTRYKALPDKRQQQRIATVSALTDKLDAFEASLLSAKDADEFATAKAAFDSEDWKALTRPDDDSPYHRPYQEPIK